MDLRFFNSFTFCKIGFPGPQPVDPLSLTVKEKPPLPSRASKMETLKIESFSSTVSSCSSSTQSSNMHSSPVSAAAADVDNSTKEAAEILLLLSRKGSPESQ